MHQRYLTYDRLAKVYNRHLSYFAGRAIPVLERLMLSHLKARVHVLDVCCGTGQLARALLARGYEVTGVDGSEQMLRFAKKNAPSARFILVDVRDMDLPMSFSGAVSVFDSLNHVLTLNGLTRVFANVRAALQPGGRFVFDLNMEQAFATRWHRFFHATEGQERCDIQSCWDRDSKLGWNHVTLRRVDDGRRTAELNILERCYSQKEVTTALHAAGFNSVDVYDAQRDLEMLGEMGRSFFVCRNTRDANG